MVEERGLHAFTLTLIFFARGNFRESGLGFARLRASAGTVSVVLSAVCIVVVVDTRSVSRR